MHTALLTNAKPLSLGLSPAIVQRAQDLNDRCTSLIDPIQFNWIVVLMILYHLCDAIFISEIEMCPVKLKV